MDTPIYINLPLFVLGLLIIIKGSDLFLDNAIWIAKASGVSQVIIGATIVSLCTTMPELVSSATASIKNAADMALGNAVGSVICNTGLILGGMLLFVTAKIRKELFLIKGTFMLGALLTGFFLIWPRPGAENIYRVERASGIVLLIFLVIYLVVNYYESIHTLAEPAIEAGQEREEEPTEAAPGEWTRRGLLFAGGAAAVAIGAYLLVEFGQRLARNLNVSEAVISLVFVALGTSLPELFTAISAVRKKAEQISVGNIFGANVLNIALVVGTSSVIRPIQVQDTWLPRMDIPVATALCGFAFLIGITRGRMGRRTGITLLLLYVAYLLSMIILGRIG